MAKVRTLTKYIDQSTYFRDTNEIDKKLSALIFGDGPSVMGRR